MFFLSVLGQDDSCQLDLLTIFQSARRHNINFGINFDDLRQVERLWRVDKVAYRRVVAKRGSLFRFTYNCIIKPGERHKFWSQEILTTAVFSQKNRKRSIEPRIERIFRNPTANIRENFCKRSRRISHNDRQNNEEMIDNNNEPIQIPEIILPQEQIEGQCSLKRFFSKKTPLRRTFDRSRDHRGQATLTWNEDMLLFLYLSKLDFENTKGLVRGFERMVDSLSCLSDLRQMDDRGQVKYLVPQASFIDKLIYGFNVFIQAQKEDLISRSSYLINGS